MKNRKWLFRVLLLSMVWAFAELCGFVGMKLLSHHTPYMSYGDYFKIRKNLLGEAEGEDLPRYVPVPSLNYVPTPNYHYLGHQQHCAAGYRGPEIPLEKTDAYRILFLGGSTTYGSGVWHPDSTYPAQCGVMLQQLLLHNGIDKSIEIINAGIESGTSAEELAYYHFKFRYYQPDLVVLHSGGNDALTGPRNPDYAPDHAGFRNINFYIPELHGGGKLLMRSYFLSFVSISLFFDYLVDYNHVLNYVPTHNLPKWYNAGQLANTPLGNDGFKNNMELLLKEIKDDSTEALLLAFTLNEDHQFSKENPDYVARTKEINAIMEELASQLGFTWLPYPKETITDMASWQDDCHLDAKGEMDKARYVGQAILPYVLKH